MQLSAAMLGVLRRAKHASFLAGKRLDHFKHRSITVVSPAYSRLIPYRFDADRYRGSFVTRTAPPLVETLTVPRRVFVIWTGDNELPPRRAESLDLLSQRLGVALELVTPASLSMWVVKGHPLHPAYHHLSLVHRSDYLRAYLLHHHGGGYSDLKRPIAAWAKSFDAVNSDREVWLAGYPEVGVASAAKVSGRVGTDLARYHSHLVGNGAMIARPNTPLTAEWVREVERRLDYFAPHIAEFPGGIRDEIASYPIPWTHLMGEVLQPLQLKHLPHVLQDSSLQLEFWNYQ